MRHLEAPADVAGPNPALGQLDYVPPEGYWKRAPVDEVAAQLVHLAVVLLAGRMLLDLLVEQGRGLLVMMVVAVILVLICN